jgi:hypothetical protein
MQSSSWASIGRASAWLHAIGYVVASIIFVLIAFNITTPAAPSAPKMTGDYALALIANDQKAWTQVLVSNLIFVVAFFALIPVSRALREALGDDPPAQLAGVAIEIGAILGMVSTLSATSTQSALLRVSDPDTAIAAVTASSVAGNTLWLLVGFLFFAGTGIFLASRLSLQRQVFSAGLARLGLLVGLVYWLGTAVNVLAALSDPATAETLARVWQLIVLVGGAVLAPIWAIWLARSLAPARAAARAAVHA